jgi:hypothetical protein
MTFPAKILPVIAAAFFVTSAQASDVPTLNVRPTCTPIGNDKTFPIDTDRCMKSEQDARDQLEREWASFPAADRSLCTQTASMGGMASYVALIVCLEMKRDVATMPADRGLTTKPAGLPAKK